MPHHSTPPAQIVHSFLDPTNPTGGCQQLSSNTAFRSAMLPSSAPLQGHLPDLAFQTTPLARPGDGAVRPLTKAADRPVPSQWVQGPSPPLQPREDPARLKSSSRQAQHSQQDSGSSSCSEGEGAPGALTPEAARAAAEQSVSPPLYCVAGCLLGPSFQRPLIAPASLVHGEPQSIWMSAWLLLLVLCL